MKRTLALGALLLNAGLALGQTNPTPVANSPADEAAVRATVDAIVTSWTNHDYSDIARWATPDADWVNIVGMWWKGRDAVRDAHQLFHKAMFRQTPLQTVRTDVRFVTPDVALVHHLTRVGVYTTPGGQTMGNDQNLATLVLVKQNGTWLLTAGQNAVVDARAAQHDPVNARH
ncbi:SgcJ/EcaC family oxidoreductase [Spirosoma luteolum]